MAQNGMDWLTISVVLIVAGLGVALYAIHYVDSFSSENLAWLVGLGGGAVALYGLYRHATLRKK